jgi:hypothetical protein
VKTKSVIALLLLVLFEMACQPDRGLDPRIAYTGIYDVVTRTTIQSHGLGQIDTLMGSEIIGVSLGQGSNQLTLTSPVNLSLTATLTGSSFTIPAQTVLIVNVDGSVNRGKFRERTGFFTGKFMSLTSVLQTDFETQTSVASGSKR